MVTSRVPQGLVLGPLICINDLRSVLSTALSDYLLRTAYLIYQPVKSLNDSLLAITRRYQFFTLLGLYLADEV